MKILDNNFAFKFNGNTGVVTYTPKFSIKKELIFIKKAVLKLIIESDNTNFSNVTYLNSINEEEVIDCVKQSGENNSIAIDVTYALSELLKSQNKDLIITFHDIEYESHSGASIYIDYENKLERLKNNETYDLNLNRAGKASINLFNGDFTLVHKDINVRNGNLPIDISHIYDSLGFFSFYENSSNFGHNWKLNLQQFLIKETLNLNEDNQTSNNFTYVDSSGKISTFNEKYYYLVGKNKNYITPSEVTIEMDGDLYYSKDDVKYKVEKELVTNSGLVLSNKLEDFIDLKYINQDIEEISNLKTKIESYSLNYKSLVNSLNDNLVYLNYLKSINKKEEITSNDGEETTAITYYNEEFNLCDLSKYKTYSVENIKDNLKVYFLTEEELNNEKLSIDLTFNFESEGKILSDHEQKVNQFNLQLKAKLDERKSILQNLEQYEILAKQAKFEYDELLKRVPVHYIQDSEGTMLGFSPTNEENKFRLTIIADSYNNAIYINYDEEDRILSIINSEEQEIKFIYENNYLKNIIDEKNRITHFEYDNGYLIKITYPNGFYSKYEYENNMLTKIINFNSQGVELTYTNNLVSEIKYFCKDFTIKKGSKEISNDNNYIECDKISIDYYDYKSTMVKNLKTNKCTTYIFDNLGNIVTIYENNINGNKFCNVKVVSFDKNNENKSFVIEPLKNVENLLSGGTFTGYTLTQDVESYFGDDILCGEDIGLVNFETAEYLDEEIFTLNKPNVEAKIERKLESKNLNKIKNNGVTDLVLSGWAKADSAWVERRVTDYNSNTQEELNIFDKLILESSDEIRKNRRFELRAELKYLNKSTNTEFLDEQYCSFDWMNTDWQYCAFPVTIKEDSNLELLEIKVIFDYSFNINKAEFFGMELRESKWEYKEYTNNLITYVENSLTNSFKTFEYNKKKLVKQNEHKFETISGQKVEKIYTTEYFYNQNGSLVRSVDSNGIISENEYNDKGKLLKSYTYNKDEPSIKLYSFEEALDEKGQKTSELNELGEKVRELHFDNFGKIKSTTVNENKMSYGYDFNDDTLLSTSISINGEKNSNILGYDFDYLTNVSHNDFEYNFEYDGKGRKTKIKINDDEYINISYEEIKENQLQADGTNIEVVIGEKITQTLVNGEKFLTYKNLEGNVTKLEYINKTGFLETIYENFYDLNGNLIKVQDKNANSILAKYYNKFNNLYKVESNQNGSSISLENDFDETNQKVTTTSLKLDDIELLNYKYIYDNDTLKTINLNENSFQNLSYDNLGRMSVLNTNNNSKEFVYLSKGDHTSNLVTKIKYAKDNAVTDNLTYKYDNQANLVEVRKNNVLVVRYQYDELSRLIREDNKELDKTFVFSYDIGGNINTRIEYEFTLSENILEEGAVYNYGYALTGWRDQLLSYNNKKFDYDEMGNPTKYKDLSLSWSKGRQLDIYHTTTFTYNENGIRTSKTHNGKTTKFYLDGTKILYQTFPIENETKSILYFYGIEGVAGFEYENQKYFYKKNIQGDVIGILNASGDEIVQYVYDAWGNHECRILTSFGTFEQINSTKEYTTTEQKYILIANTNPFRYRGYYYDTETGLYYLNSRYYDPELGRFINADDISYLAPDIINGLNLYSYCNNNPVNFTDQNGNAWWDWLISAVLLVAVIVGTAAITLSTGGVATTMLIGIGIGATIGGTTSVITQLSSGQGFSLGQFFLDVGFGAITGLIGSSSLGILGAGIAMGVTSFAQSLTNDLFSTGNVNYGKAAVYGMIGGILGAHVGAQHGLTNKAFMLKESLKNIGSKIVSETYSLRGGNGALNLVSYHLKTATNILKTKSITALMFNTFASNIANEEIFKFLLNSIF